MITKCVNCEFNVTNREKFCPNCGLVSPQEAAEAVNSDSLFSNLVIVIAGGLALTATFLIMYLRTDGRFDSWKEFPFIFIGSSLVGLLFSMIIATFIARRLAKQQKEMRFVNQGANETFQSIQETIEIRKIELEERYREVEELLSYPSENKRNTEILQRARQLLAEQIARYELRDYQLFLIRLQNDLRPIFYETNLQRRTKEFLELADQAVEELREIRSELTNYYAIEFPPSTRAERDNFLSYLDETESSFLKIREALLSRHTADTLQNLSPFGENLMLPDEKVFAHSAETFNLQTSLTDFSRSFNETEREYQRIEAETEISRKLSE